MSDLFDDEQRSAILTRLDRLEADTRPQWGKMNAGQMLAHCQVPLGIALGRGAMKRSLMGRLLGRLFLRKVLGAAPFPKNLPTDARFRIGDEREFVQERASLARLVRQFGERGPAAVARDPHPFFGVLKPQEWSTLVWKHLDHHLRQFGA